MIPEQQRLLETFTLLVASALERLTLTASEEQARLTSERESLRNSLLAALSHDLRTPLTILFGQAEILTLDLASEGSKHAPQANEIRQHVLNTTRLVNNLLDMARIQSGGFNLHKEWLTLEEIVGSALRMLEPGLGGQHIQLSLPDQLLLVHVDGPLFERVLINLLENAHKYAGAQAQIGIHAEADMQQLIIEVWDNGPGIPAGQNRLSLINSRVVIKSRLSPASVWGWRFARRLSRYTRVALPPATVRKAAPVSVLHCREKRPRTGRVNRGNVINVLIIEDEHAIRRFLRTALEVDGMRVYEAETLQRGLIEAATRKPDLAILDLGLPDGDGNDFIREVRQWSQMPIIVLSARSEEHDKIAALDAGADDYLSKPFGIGELQARLRVALRRHGSAQADEPVVRFADISVDIPARRIMRGSEEIHLTPIEFRLLAALLNNPGKVLTQRQLLNQVWGPNAVEHSHYLRIYMGHLRQKLEADPARPQHLLTETGIGYRFMP